MKSGVRWIMASLVLLGAAAAQAQSNTVTITNIANGAYCRDQTGKVTVPNVRPALPVQGRVDNALGMVAAAPGDCYFYNREVVLSTSQAYPSASQGGENANQKVFGTRSLRPQPPTQPPPSSPTQ